MRGTQSIAIFLCAQMVLLSLASSVSGDEDGVGTRSELILKIGAQDDMKTRNILAVGGIWSKNVLSPIYQSVGVEHPDTGDLTPYLLKGIDADESGVFDLDEYGIFEKEEGTDTLNVTAYYDFNGVHSHDGVQMTMHDLLFSYHLRALDPQQTRLDFLKDKGNQPGSNYSTTRWLNIWPVEDSWDSSIPVGDNDTLTFAFYFSPQGTYAYFARYVLADAIVIPRHLWEGTGKVCREAQDGACLTWELDIHSEFGRGYDSATHNGVPAADPNAFDFPWAESWLMEDDLVIGTGPFRFGEWNPGVMVRTDRFEDYKADVLDCSKVGDPPRCQGSFSKYMHKPYIDGMQFRIYKTTQAAVFALQANEIDVISWYVPPDYVSGLIDDDNIGLSTRAEKGFYYLGYNMRRSPFGYPDNDPWAGDDGLYLRKAIAHVIDKRTIIPTILLNFGVEGDQPVSPAYTMWYNASVPRYDYEPSEAEQILDDHYTVDGLGLGWGPHGYRNLPTIGDREIEILCPAAHSDPILAYTCNMVAVDMRLIGINAQAKLLAYHEIKERIDNHNMEMWMLGERIDSPPPEYYWDFFYSGNARAGLNYAGFQNETLDALLTQARSDLNLNTQRDSIKECSGLLTDALPYDVLYFRTNVEAYRQTRFANWTFGPADSIFIGSFWSWIGIHSPPSNALHVSLIAISAMADESTAPIIATVTDPRGSRLADAPVRLSLEGLGLLGYLSIGTEQGISLEGMTDTNGELEATYHAPETDQYLKVTVSAQALRLGPYSPSLTRYTTISIYPIWEPHLSIYADPLLTFIRVGQSLPIDIQVVSDYGCENSRAVDGAYVNISIQPDDAMVTPDSGFTEEGSIGIVIFQAPSSLPEGLISRDYDVTVTASLEGYDTEVTTLAVTVMESQGKGPPEILDIIVRPRTGEAGGPVNISARFLSIDPILEGTCQILDSNLNEVESIRMQYDSASDRYYCKRSYDESGMFHFTIWASDGAGNTNWTSGTFEIVPPFEWASLWWVPLVILLLVVAFLVVLRGRRAKEDGDMD